MSSNKKRNIVFTTLVIIILCITGGYLIYNKTMSKDNGFLNEQDNNKNEQEDTNNKNDQEDINNEYEIVSYYGKVGEYIIERDGGIGENQYIKIFKIDSSYNKIEIYNSKDSNLLWKNVEIYEYDKNKYIIMGYDDINNKMKLYKFDENKNNLNEFFTREVDDFSTNCNPLENDYVFGIEWSEGKQDYYYLFDENKVYNDNEHFEGDSVRLSVGDSIITNHEKNYVRIRNHSNYEGNSFGLYDIENNKKIIDTKYTQMKHAFSDYYVVEKDGKAGIIDSKENILVDFEYDYIVPEEGYLLVAKDKKIAVMNEEFKLVSGFEIDTTATYGYDFCCGDTSNIVSIKINNKIFLSINLGAVYVDPWTHYIIYEDGSYKNIDGYELISNHNNDYQLAKIDDGIVSIYDINLNKKFDLKVPNITKESEVSLLKDAYFIEDNKNFYIFDRETGKQITGPYNINEDLSVEYNISPSTDKSKNDENLYYDIIFYENDANIYEEKHVSFTHLKYIYDISEINNNTYYFGDYDYNGDLLINWNRRSLIIKKR